MIGTSLTQTRKAAPVETRGIVEVKVLGRNRGGSTCRRGDTPKSSHYDSFLDPCRQVVSSQPTRSNRRKSDRHPRQHPHFARVSGRNWRTEAWEWNRLRSLPCSAGLTALVVPVDNFDPCVFEVGAEGIAVPIAKIP